jgi:chromosome segregation ATPase
MNFHVTWRVALTSSNGTSRKFRTYTWIAVALAAIMIASLLVIFVQVRTLDEKWGTLAADRERIERQTSDWQARRDRLDIEVEELEERISNLVSELSDLKAEEARRNVLRQEVENLLQRKREAETFLNHNKEIQKQISSAQETLITLRHDISRSRTAYENLNSQTTSLEREVASLAARRDELHAQRDRLNREVADVETLRAEVENLLTKKSELIEIVNETRSSNQKLELEYQRLQARVVSTSGQLQDHEGRLTTGSQQKEALETELAGLKGEISASKLARDNAEAERRRLESLAGDLRNQVVGLKAQEQNAKKRAEQGLDDLARIESELTARRAELARTDAQLAERARLAHEARELVGKIKGLEGTINGKIDERNNLTKAISELREERQQLQNEAKELSDARNRRAVVLEAIEQLEMTRAKLTSDVSRMSANREQAHDDAMQAAKELAALQAEINALVQNKANLLTQIAALEARLDNLAAEKEPPTSTTTNENDQKPNASSSKD